MTLMNGLVHKGRATLWTDTGLWNAATGEWIGDVSKAFFGIEWPWAAVVSATMVPDDPYSVQRLVAEAKPRTPAELIEASRAALREQVLAGRMGRILLAHICPEYGARMYLIASDPLPFAKAFEPYEAVEFMSSGSGSPWAAEFADKVMTPALMRRFIDRQIEHPADTVLGWNGHNIGGNIVELRLTAAGAKGFMIRENVGRSHCRPEVASNAHP